MFSAVQEFVRKHQRKFIVGGIVIGGVVLFSDYVKRALKEEKEKERQVILERHRKYQHYESTEEMCNKTAMTLAQILNSTITKQLKAESIVRRLKAGSPRRLGLWKELMIVSFTKVIVMVYSSAMMMILLRVQLNLIGGYIYRDNIDGTKKLDRFSLERYLTSFNRIVQTGIIQFISLIEPKVSMFFDKKSLDDKVTIKDIEKIFSEIYYQIGRDPLDPCRSMDRYFAPLPDRSFNREGKLYYQMLDDAVDIFRTDEFEKLAVSAVIRGFNMVMEELSYQFGKKYKELNSESDAKNASSSQNEDDFVDLSKFSLPMARVIPLVNNLVPDVYKSNGFADSLMQMLIQMNMLRVLGANVYETFSSKLE